MERATKYFDNLADFEKALAGLHHYQKVHNIIRNDYLELLALTEATDNQKQFNALYRACLRELFSLIESDLFGLNHLDAYPGYSDHEKFVKKFKKTFEQISTTQDKDSLRKPYFETKFEKLLTVKRERDSMTHPKKPEDFPELRKKDFENLKAVFQDYDDFINDLMNGFFIGMKNYPGLTL